MKMKYTFIILSMLCLALLSAGCDKSESKEQNTLELTYVPTPSGIDDSGYNQAIYTSLKSWLGDHRTIQAVFTEPQSLDEARKIYADWQKSVGNDKKSVIIMAGSDYLDLVKKETGTLNSSQNVLLIEAAENEALPAGVSSFYIDRDGASYLMGCLASTYEEPLIIAALEKEQILQNYIHAFSEGLKSASGKAARVEYLSEGYEGFNMPEKAYQICRQNPNTFIYPLNGKSIKGVFQALDESNKSDKIVSVGLDMDCNPVSKRIVASMILNFYKVFDTFLGSWEKGEKMPVYRYFGMEEGYAEIKLNENYETIGGITLEDYRDLKDRYYQEALDFEKK